MIEIGIRAHDIGRFPPEELAAKVRELGFSGVQLVFNKALSCLDPFQQLENIKKAFTNPKIMMLGAYFNPLHPDAQVVRQGMEAFKAHLRIASSLNAKYVGTETGSLMGSPWGYLKENHEESAFLRLVEIVKDLVKTAETFESTVAIEGAYAHVVYQPLVMRRLLDLIPSPNLKVTVDLFNYLHPGNFETRMEILEDCFSLFRDKIVIFHLKDFVCENHQLRQVGLGQGLMDYPAIIARIREETPEADLVFEGVTGEDIKTSYHLIANLLKKGASK